MFLYTPVMIQVNPSTLAMLKTKPHWEGVGVGEKKQIKLTIAGITGEGNGNPLQYWSNPLPFQYSCLENPMDGGAWQTTVHEVTKSDTTERHHFSFITNKRLSKILKNMKQNVVIKEQAEAILGEGNGNPLHYSCLENPMDRGAWWATVHEAAQSWT